METDTKERYKKNVNMEKASIFGLMDRIMKDTTVGIKSMEKVF